MMRVWLDDVRFPPAGWVWAQRASDVIHLLKTGEVEELSLDHDLGLSRGVGTGYDVLAWIEEAVVHRGFKPPLIRIHSMNIVARRRMEAALESIHRLEERRACE